jgi:ubiquinone/menaquinone biosynthesis C-methylase UbiE
MSKLGKRQTAETINGYPERYSIEFNDIITKPHGFLRNILCKIISTIDNVMYECRINVKCTISGIIESMPYRGKILVNKSIQKNGKNIPYRTVDMSKREYDQVGDREHSLYDLNQPIEPDCCGIMRGIGYAKYRDYISEIIASRISADSRILLDFGSGNGFNAKYLSARFAKAEIIGIDISIKRIENATSWIGNVKNIKFVQMNGECLAFSDNSFDIVYSCHALEQMESIIDDAVSEIIRVMKHRAIFIEPVWENADIAQKSYLKRYDYVRSLIKTLKKKNNIDVIENFRLGIQGSPLNQSSILVIEKTFDKKSR